MTAPNQPEPWPPYRPVEIPDLVKTDPEYRALYQHWLAYFQRRYAALRP